MPEHAHEYPLCSELMAGFARPWLLYVAALFHDIAKGRGGDHSALGRVDARRFCRDHALSDEDTALVEFLVLNHLTLSSVAQKQDSSDPAVVARFAALVGTERRLVALYLLTVADIRGTSPKVWNAWKGKLLEDLFFATRQALHGNAPSTHTRVEAVQRDAARVLSLYGIDEAHYARFWQQLDVPYFLRHEAQDIAWHVRALHSHVDTATPIVRSRLSPVGEGFEVVVYLPDQPDLFARICGYFDSRRLSVLEARIHTTRHGYALDTFVLVDPDVTARGSDALHELQEELARRLAERVALAPPVEGRSSRRSRHFPIEPSVELQADERGQRFLLSIVANDRTGLLYRIARVLARHRINVHTARITTLGERVEDVFLIDGEALERPRESRQLQGELLQALRV
jgi:[protein-PII] uridylyltransferase